jgi:hypothetical protein
MYLALVVFSGHVQSDGDSDLQQLLQVQNSPLAAQSTGSVWHVRAQLLSVGCCSHPFLQSLSQSKESPLQLNLHPMPSHVTVAFERDPGQT